MMREEQSTPAKKQRWDYIDVAKGLGMLAVILGHIGLSGWNIFIFSFHMPLFFIISGFFFHTQDNRGYLVKRSRQLLIPYVFTCVCIILLAILRETAKAVLYGGELLRPIKTAVVRWSLAGILGSGSRTDYFGINCNYFIGAIWFLLAMFWAGLLVNILLKHKHGSIAILIIGAIGLISAKFIWLPWSIQPATAAAVYILIGYSLRNKLDRLENVWVVIGCFCCWICYLTLCYSTNKKIAVVDAVFPWWVIDFVGSTAATVCVLYVSRIICRITRVTKRFLVWYGRNSLIVLCFHLMELFLFQRKIVRSFIAQFGTLSPLVLVIVYAAEIIWTCAGVVAAHKVKALRYVFTVNYTKATSNGKDKGAEQLS